MFAIENIEDWKKRILFPIGDRKRMSIQNIIGVDTEDNSRGGVTMAGFFNGKQYTIFKGFDEVILGALNFINELQKVKKQKFYFFANNMLYDLVNLFGEKFLLEKYFTGELKIFFTKGGFVFMQYGRTYWIDLQNYYRGYSVKKLGDLIGVPKLETDSKASDVDYMKRDIEIHYLAAKKLIDLLNDSGLDFGYTIGSVSMKTFRRLYIDKNFYRADTKFLDDVRDIYKGGRVEMFKQGKVGKVYIYDINSLYPYIMKKTYFWRPDKIYKAPEDFLCEDGIYYCKVRVNENEKIPLLNSGDFRSLIFPVGVFKTYATGRELIESGAEILDIYWGYCFEIEGKIFEKFVVDFYKKRLKAKDKFEKLFFKLILNNLYGKFAQGRYRIEIRKKNNLYFFDEKLEENYQGFANLFWAVQVTSEARIYLWQIMNRVLSEGIKIYYTDTDSIHTNKPIPDDLISQTKLGKFKLEGVYNKARYFAEKEYILGDFEKLVCKGIPKFNRKEYFEKGYTTYERPVKFREGLRRNIKINVWTEIRKIRQTRVPKRIYEEKGNSRPIYLDENLDIFPDY